MPRPERPLGSEDSALLAFAADLRRLREKAGKPTYRELSAKAHYSVTVLSDAASGRRLPSLAVTLAYVEVCGGAVEEWRERWHELAAELAAEPSTGPDGDDRRPPYLGLAAFQVDDADRFFGRDALVEQLVTRVRERRFLGVFGASGSGKSSLLRAGLAARTEGPVLVFTPGPHPREECAVQLATLTGRPVGQVIADLADPAHLHLYARMADHEVLLVVDQFEEVFTLCADPDERAWFVDALVTAALAETSRVRVVLGVRADFYGHCGRYPRLVAALQDSQVLVGPMSADELRQAITRPAVQVGCVIDTALVSRLVAEAAGQPAALPLVSHALLETWRRRRGTRLTVDGYEEAGGIQHAITRSAEDVYSSLDEAGRAQARQIFLRLTALGEGTADTKRRVPRDSIEDGPVVERLAAARLITVDDSSVEITHEALIRCWPRLRDWLSDDREGLRLHRQLTEATEAWAAVGHDPGALYRGVRLASARDWAARNDHALTPRERRFLTASLAEEASEQDAARLRTRRLRQLVAALTVFVLLTTVAGGVALLQRQHAVAERDQAASRQAGERAAGLLASDPSLAGQLGRAALRVADTPEARGAMLSTFAAPYPTRYYYDGDQIDSVALRPDGGLTATGGVDGVIKLWDREDLATLPNTGRITGLAFSRDGKLLAAATARGTSVWDVSSPRSPTRVVEIQPGVKANDVAFNADASVLATAGADGVTRLWDRRGTQVAALPGHTGEVYKVAFGAVLATAGEDGRVLVWEGDTSKPVATAKGPVSALAFGPDGRTLAFADETHAIWLAVDGGAAQAFPGPDVLVRGLAFTPDGTRMALGGNDGHIRIMDIAGRREVARLTQPNRVRDLAFNGDGTRMATSSSAGRAYLWHDPLSNPIGHTAELQGIAAHPDSGLVATTASLDPVVRLWRTDWRRLEPLSTVVGHTDAVQYTAFSPSGKILATASRDRTVRLWQIDDVSKPVELAVLGGYRETVSRVAWSPDGTTLATGDDAGDLVLWDATFPRSVVRQATLADDFRNVNALAFSPDGSRLASGNADRTVRLWDVTDRGRPRQLFELTGFREAVTSVAFNADGTLVAAAGLDRTARVWQASDGASLSTLTGHTGPVWTVGFGRDGRTLTTTSGDRTARLWDVGDPRNPVLAASLRSPNASVSNVFTTEDGMVAVASNEHFIRFFGTDLDAAARRLCEQAGTPMTRDEWTAQFPNLPYEPPCR